MAIKVRWVAAHDGEADKSSGRARLEFIAFDTDETRYNNNSISDFGSLVNDCYLAVLSASPLTFQGLTRKSISWREDDNRTKRFIFEVNYSWALEESIRRWSFDTAGGTFRITTSLFTTAYTKPGGFAPNFQNAIEVRDGKPEGIDITIPGLKLTCTYRHPVSSPTVNASTIDNYIKMLSNLTGTTNNATWLTYERGELLFLGASGEYVPNKPAEFQYHFAASANASNLTIGTITNIVKRGHEYVWVLFEPKEDTTAHKMVQTPLAAYVERVYRESTFTDLGIG